MTLLIIPALIVGLPVYIIWRLVTRDRKTDRGWQPDKKRNGRLY